MSSSKLNNPNTSNTRDYGATSSRNDMPDVNFSGFSPTEIVSLSDDTGNNIIAINANIRKLERMLKDIDTQNDHQYKRDEMKNIMDQTNGRIDSTSGFLKRLASVVPRSDKQQKLQFEKLTNDFRTTCDKYAKVQRRMVNALRKSISVLQRHEEDVEQNTDNGSEEEQMAQNALKKESMQQEMKVLIDRHNDVQRIENDIAHLNNLMYKFASSVQEQAESVDQIESHVEDAAVNVEEGHSELAKALTHRQSHRRKILILLIIAVIVGLIVTGIIVGKLKS